VVQGASEDAIQRDFIPLILQTMAETDTAQRKLALKTGISKSRLGVLLHHDPEKRSPMTLDEFQVILHALDTNIVQAFIRLETFREPRAVRSNDYGTLIAMLCDVFVTLPKKLIEVLDAFDGLDGSEVRKEWAPPLQKAVLKRLADEVLAVSERRARLAQSDDFRI
jgi:hypothetical protein